MATQLFLMRLSGVSSKVTCRFSPVRCGISWGRRGRAVRAIVVVHELILKSH
jgi:hypothetical protein